MQNQNPFASNTGFGGRPPRYAKKAVKRAFPRGGLFNQANFNQFNQNNYDEPPVVKPNDDVEPEKPPRSCFRIAI